MVERRDLLKAAVGALTAAVVPGEKAGAQGPAPAPAAAFFSRDRLLEEARKTAAKPFAPVATDLAEFYTTLSREHYEAISTKPEALIWAGENRGFQLEPLLRGWVYGPPVDLRLVDGGAESKPPFDPAKLDFGEVKLPEKMPEGGFSGFRVLPEGEVGKDREAAAIADFQGASFFHAKARGQSKWGVAARGLSIRTADPQGEEFPTFQKFWIERPAPGANALIIHALLDSPSVVGVYRFTLRAGEATIIDTELTLFPRVELDHIGIASLAGTSLFTPLDRRRVDDIRPAACEVNGLQILTGKDEWLWRPLSNRNSLQYSSFVDANPKGFGFIMRNRDIGAYQDDWEHWEQRPSVWIEPLHDWGEGAVQLVEIPSESELNDNIIAYWRPKQRLGRETSFAYRQFWCWDPPTRPPLAIVTDARSGRGVAPKHRRFVVVFGGDILADAARPPIKATLTPAPGNAVIMREAYDAGSRTHRVVFEVDPGNETYCELRLALKAGEEQISETWLYRWTV